MIVAWGNIRGSYNLLISKMRRMKAQLALKSANDQSEVKNKSTPLKTNLSQLWDILALFLEICHPLVAHCGLIKVEITW